MRPRPSLLAGTLACLMTSSAVAQVSRNCELLSKRTRAGSTGYAGVWGYTAPDGREFALVGSRQGTWIVETTDPRNPVEKGFIPGPSSTWREISSYRDYVYTVTESAGGVQIISMVNPDAPVLVKNFTVAGWNNTHSVSVDQGAGKLYCNGTSGGMRIFDISADPTTPVPVATYTSAYVHDSFIQNGFAYLSCINNGQLRIVNVSSLPTITPLSATTTPLTFTHNAWADSTDTIAVTTDERSNGFLQVYDVSNKAAPVRLGSYSVAGAGVHNAFIVDDKVAHVSWYGAGYRAVDITNPASPVEIGYYDTASAWGCYPFQPSGNVYVSDIPSSGGLFVVKLTCGVPERYGKGTAGTGGFVPRADWNGGFARVANPGFTVQGKRALGGAPAILALGLGRGSVMGAGIEFLLDPTRPLLFLATTATGTGPGNGTASVPLPIPNDPSLAGGSVFFQWVFVDAGGPQGFSASEGMGVAICN
jgi:choice-of-anchor B domain-containing protein